MVRMHVFIKGLSKQPKQPAIFVLHAVPRVGDEIRFDAYTFAKVIRVVWCFDEETDGHQRANVETVVVK